MMYHLKEEASGAIYGHSENPFELIKEAKEKGGKWQVITDLDTIIYDSQPNISYKI